MNKKGICPNCGKDRWLDGKGGRCRACTHPITICLKCGITRRIWVEGLCSVCYEDRQTRAKLIKWHKNWNTTYPYNAQLMELYITYISRYQLKYVHFCQAKQLGELFQSQPCPTLTHWHQIYKIALKYPLKFRPTSRGGVVWRKIGYMLQELGVLPPRDHEYEFQIEAKIQQFDSQISTHIAGFQKKLSKSRSSGKTCMDYLASFSLLDQWIKTNYPNSSLLHVNTKIFEKYFLSIEFKSPSYLQRTWYYFRRFYRYLMQERAILCDPIQNVTISNVPKKLTVCDNAQIQKLVKWIKDPSTPSEQAMLLSLILFFGLSIQDIRLATFCIDEKSQFSIIHHRTPRTKGRRYYNRPQKLILPQIPDWFFSLQKRFYLQWLERLKEVKFTYPRQSLILIPKGHHNRPPSDVYVASLIAKATEAALGQSIPCRILKQTCGHIYSAKGDASILSQLGWSPSFAFNYTWLPRTYFTQSKSR